MTSDRLFRRWLGDNSDDQPPLVLLHGLFGSADNLGMVARGVKDSRRTLSIDLRGHGRSPHHRPITYQTMAQDVLQVMREEGIERAPVYGHSMGGKVAMQMALDAPEHVAGLIVGDIAPVEYGHNNHEAVLKAQAAIRDARPEGRPGAEAIARDLLREEMVIGFILTNWRRLETGDWGWRHDLDGIQQDYAHIAAAPQMGVSGPYEGPVLFIRGGLSDYILPAHKEATITLFPQAQARTIEGTGHWFHAEKTETTVRLVQRFLNHMSIK